MPLHIFQSQSTLTTLFFAHFAAGGKPVIFTRWGSDVCPSGTKKLYAGAVGNAHFTHHGSGGNYLCLHPDPEFPEGWHPGSQNGGMMYGAEYENSGTVDKNQNKDPGCVVCEHESAASVYVQWGRKTCSNGHKTEYYGLIMAQKHSEYKSTFICVDWLRAVHSKSKDANNGGGHLYTTEFFPTKYGEYKKGNELSCAVCSTASGSVYTRWGSKTCPSGATELYESFMVNGRDKDEGNGMTYLCMHPKPQFPEGMSAGLEAGALISPVEYKNNGALDKNQFQEAACVVCHRAQAESVYTQWGRKSCTNDHQLEYYGIIMSSYSKHTKTEWICVDWQRAYYTASDKSDNQHYSMLYSAETEAGAMDDDYGQDREISCAVCSSALPVYTRWGSQTCPEDSSTKLYAGSMANALYTHPGGGYNYLCMHPKPEWPEGVNAGSQEGAHLYGVEYKNTGAVDKNQYHDAGCVVCQMKEPKTKPYVQWGRKTCSNDAKLVYHGLLMAAAQGDQKGEWICVDWERSGHKTSKSSNENSGFLLTTEFETGVNFGLDQYGGDKEMACVVCA